MVVLSPTLANFVLMMLQQQCRTKPLLSNMLTANLKTDWCFKDRYCDEYTMEPLPQEQIRDAIVDELSYFNDNVWLGVDVDEAKADAEGKILSGRWVLSNKGDNAAPDCRARYVACEVHTYDDTAFFAATPPLEAKRILLSQFASQISRGGPPLQLHFSDAKKA